MLYVLKLEERDYMRDLAQAQIAIDKEAGYKKFEEYRKLMFPWIETAKKRSDNEIHAVMQREFQRGPLGIRAVGNNKIQSRLRKHSHHKPLSAEDRAKQETLFKALPRYK